MKKIKKIVKIFGACIFGVLYSPIVILRAILEKLDLIEWANTVVRYVKHIINS